MTTAATIDFTSAVASGTAPIPFNFQAVSAAEISVLRAGLVQPTVGAYTVELNGDGTGTVTPLSSWGTDAVTILSDPTFQQPDDFSRYGAFYPDQFNTPLDRLARGLIALKGRLDRTAPDATLRTDLASTTGAARVKDAAGQTLQQRLDQVFGINHGTLPSGAVTSLDVSRIANGVASTQWYAEQKRIYAAAGQFDYVRGLYQGTHIQTTSTVANADGIHQYVWGEANASITNGAGISSHLRLDAGADVTNEFDCFNVVGATYAAGSTAQRVVGLRVGNIGDATKVQEAFGVHINDYDAASLAIGIRGDLGVGANKYFLYNGGGAQAVQGGFMSIGKTSAPVYPLDVAATWNNWTANITNSHASSPFGMRIRYSGSSPNNASTNEFIWCEDATTSRFIVRSNGNVVNTNNSYGAISDRKLKAEIRDASSQLDDVRALRVRKFHLKSDPAKRDMIGFVAQEVEKISPGLVETARDYETRRVQRKQRGGVAEPDVPIIGEYDEERHPLKTTTKSVNYSIAYMKLFKAFQELADIVEQQGKAIAALKAKAK